MFRSAVWTANAVVCLIGIVTGWFMTVLSISLAMALDRPATTIIILLVGGLGSISLASAAVVSNRLLHYRLAATLAILGLGFQAVAIFILYSRSLKQWQVTRPTILSPPPSPLPPCPLRPSPLTRYLTLAFLLCFSVYFVPVLLFRPTHTHTRYYSRCPSWPWLARTS